MTVPAVTSVYPVSGPPAGGTVVSITGTNLTGATSVHFGAATATPFAVLSDTQVVADAPAGSGAVDVTVTTPGGTSLLVPGDLFTFSSGLFTVAEARLYDRQQLGDEEIYAAAKITATELLIRARFERICGVAFVERTPVETRDGVASSTIRLKHRNPTLEDPQRPITVTAASIDGVAFTADQLADLVPYPDGRVVRKWLGYWLGAAPNARNVSVTYKHGWATVPAPIAEAALRVCLSEVLLSDLSRLDPRMTSIADGSGMSYSLVTPGLRGAWFDDPLVNEVLTEYQEPWAL